jgi:histidinol-phosphatase (PHP family)
MVGPILYESHMHTPLCKHASGDPEAYAAAAEKRGLQGIIVTCHNPPIDNWTPRVRMAENQFDQYVALVARATEAWAGRVDVRLGMECDYLPGMEEGLVKQLARAEFHHILGSVHPQIPEYKERYASNDPLALQHIYFEHLAQAAESGLFDTLAHPDLVKNEAPEQWDVEAMAEVIGDSLDRIAATGVAMELNTSGLNKRLPEMNPGPWMLSQMQQRGIPVVIGADAHTPNRVADKYPDALKMLKVAGYSHVSFFLNRERQDVSIDLALASLQTEVVAV